MHLIEHTTPTVLLVDDCRFTRRALFNAIEAAMPECKIICVPSLMAAQAAGAELKVDLFIVDAVLQDGSGVDFLADMLMVQEGASAILLSDGALPSHLKNCAWFHQVHVLRKAVNRAQLLWLMQESLGERCGVTLTGKRPCWSARLEEISPEEVIHTKTDLFATAILEFVGRGEAGVVHFQNGRITYAETSDSHGEEALRKILSWRRGFAFELPPESVKSSKSSAVSEESPGESSQEIDRQSQLDNISNVVGDETDEMDGAGLRASSNC